jgi:hypothetical protein
MPPRPPGRRTLTAVKSRRSSGMLRGAQKGRGIFDYALAILIWHEMAHLAGADEREAQRQQEDLWMAYVATGRVDTNRGLNYLALLKKRH